MATRPQKAPHIVQAKGWRDHPRFSNSFNWASVGHRAVSPPVAAVAAAVIAPPAFTNSRRESCKLTSMTSLLIGISAPVLLIVVERRLRPLWLRGLRLFN